MPYTDLKTQITDELIAKTYTNYDDDAVDALAKGIFDWAEDDENYVHETHIGNVNITGVLTATSFVGIGALITGVPGTMTVSGSDFYFNTGKMGIGASSPAELLEVEDGNAITAIQISNTAADGDPVLAFALSGTKTFTMGIDDGDGDKFKIGTSAIGTNTRFTIDSTGKVGVGITTPDGTFHVHTASAGAITAHTSYDDLVVENSGGTGISILGGTSSITGIQFGDSGNASIGTVAYNHNGDYLYFRSNNAEQVRIDSNGNVGIGTAVPAYPLAVNRSGDGVIVAFESADTVEGSVSISGTTTSYNAFLGSHYTQLKTGQKELPVGAVVVSTGEIISCTCTKEEETETESEILIENAFEDIRVTEETEKVDENGDPLTEDVVKFILDGEEVKSETVTQPVMESAEKTQRQLKSNVRFDGETGKLFETVTSKNITQSNVPNKEHFPYVKTTTKAGDSTVYGVWFSKMSDDSKGMSFGDDNKPVYLIAQVGLFKIRVTDTNGNIKNGDFLESSSRAMEAQKQMDVNRKSSTISKALVDVDWSTETEDPDLGYKWKLIPCVF